VGKSVPASIIDTDPAGGETAERVVPFWLASAASSADPAHPIAVAVESVTRAIIVRMDFLLSVIAHGDDSGSPGPRIIGSGETGP